MERAETPWAQLAGQAGARVSLSRQSLVVVLTVTAPYASTSHKSIRIIVFFIFEKFRLPVPLFLFNPTLYYIHSFNDDVLSANGPAALIR